MSLLLGPIPSFNSAPPSQTNQPSDEQSQSVQSPPPEQSSPPPAPESQPVTGSPAANNNADASTPPPNDAQLASQSQARSAPPVDGEAKSVFEANTAVEATPTDDEASARRDAEAARQAYIQQSIIDRVQAAPTTSVTSLFEASEAEKPTDTDQTTRVDNASDAPAATAEDPFAETE